MSLLWSPEHLVRWVVGVAVSAFALLGAWAYASGKTRYSGQVIGLDIAVLALIAAQVSGATLLLQGRRQIGLRRLALLGEAAATTSTAGAIQPATLDATTQLVAGAGLTRYHRTGCALATGKDLTSATRAEHESLGRRPCGVCQP